MVDAPRTAGDPDADPDLSREYLKTVPEAKADELADLTTYRTAIELHLKLLIFLQQSWGQWTREGTPAAFRFSDPQAQRKLDSTSDELRKIVGVD